MFSGLSYLFTGFPRIPKEEFQTFTDPFVKECFDELCTPGELTDFHNWSRSFYSLDSHLETIQKYNKPIVNPPDNEDWRFIVSESHNYFQNLPKATALSAESDLKRVKYHSDTSAGYGYHLNPQPYPTHKGELGSPNYNRALSIASKIIHEVKYHSHNRTFDSFAKTLPGNSTPDIAFTRTQLSELPNMKVRNVFGEAFHYVLLEGLFAQPLIETFMANDTFYYIGHDPVYHVPILINSLPESQDMFYMSFDWSSFDASVQPYEIELAFDLMERMLIYPDEVTKYTFTYCKTLFMSRKLAGPDGTVYMRYSGVPSGSYFTHLVDSIINWVRIRYLARRANFKVHAIYTHGDDALTAFSSPIWDTSIMLQEAEDNLWWINKDKTALEVEKTRLSFLSRNTRYGFNVRPIFRARRLALYPEYEVHDPQISIARLKSIDQDSGGMDPLLQQSIFRLTSLYGDNKLTLPKEFRRYLAHASYIQPESI